jgi:hypothetical protein
MTVLLICFQNLEKNHFCAGLSIFTGPRGDLILRQFLPHWDLGGERNQGGNVRSSTCKSEGLSFKDAGRAESSPGLNFGRSRANIAA